jgi:putative toxin-antitoxin system antitoxin component (TIGR02293 family)
VNFMNTRTRAQVYENLKERRRRGEVPDDPDSVRTLAIRALADRVFGDEKKADDWLHRPNKALSDQKPFDLLKDELGAAVVREILEQIDHGIFA